MNIIKFKDQIRPLDDLFNTYLKGKYAYWIQMRYVVPFECISQAEYIKYEADPTEIAKQNICWDLYCGDLEMYVDLEGTDSANNIMPFERANKFTTDSDLTLEEIKRFRTWLASTLLDFDCNAGGVQKNQLYTESFTGVLKYYAEGMYNDVVKALMEINPAVSINSLVENSCGCGCGSGADLSNLYNGCTSLCDPLDTYRKHVYGKMVEKFSDVDFWNNFSDIFLMEFKAYIDNIIRLNLPLSQSSYTSAFVDCPCTGQKGMQESSMDILKRLSQSLEYMYTDEQKGHINYISKAFQDWSSMLYELMEWK